MDTDSINNYYILQSNSSKGILQARLFLWRADVAQAIIDEYRKNKGSFPTVKQCINSYRKVYIGKIGESPNMIPFKSAEYRKIMRYIENRWSKR